MGIGHVAEMRLSHLLHCVVTRRRRYRAQVPQVIEARGPLLLHRINSVPGYGDEQITNCCGAQIDFG